MADFNVTARFEADASAYIDAVNRARSATDQLATSVDKAGQQTSKVFDGADKSIDKTGKSAESAAKQTDGLGDSAAKAGQETQSAFDGVADGIDAAGISLDDAADSYGNLGDTAETSATQAEQAWSTVGDGVEAAGISLDGTAESFDTAGSSAEQSASTAEQAWSGVSDGIDAAGISLDDTQSSFEGAGASAEQAGSQAATAFDGVVDGVEAVGISLDDTAGSFSGLGDEAQRSGTQANGAFDGIGDGISAANIQVDGLAGSYTNLGDTISVNMQKAAQGIRNNAQEMQTMGTALTVMGGGLLAIGGAAATVGIQYNDLQQRSSAALEVLAGSAEAASAQMEELNHWMQDSPFPRETWLEAQQQLMAFGMEAERVIPTLDGVQEAVAAIGGGNAEIMQLVDILGSIEGQGRITGRELQRLGQMGIDAASIIGEQMGKTGDQIRTEITAGTLDAETAITALTTGMTEQFGGAAASLTDTWYGAVDLLRAAFRDLSADAFSFLVNPEGGGFLVDLANAASDLLYWLGELPTPLLNIAGGLTLAGGAAGVAVGGFMLLAPKVVEAWDAFQKFRVESPRVVSAAGAVGKAASAAAIGFAALQAISLVLPDALRDVGDAADFETQLRLLGDGAISTAGAFDGLFDAGANLRNGLPWQEIDNLEGAISNTTMSAGELFHTWTDLDHLFATFVPGLESDLAKDTAAIENMDEAMSSLVSSGNFEAAAAGFRQAAEAGEAQGKEIEEIAELFPEYISGLQAVAAEHGVSLEGANLYEAALGNLPPALQKAKDAADNAAEQDRLTNALEEVGVAADGTVESLSDYLDMLFATGLAAMSEQDAHFAYQESLRGIGEAVEQLTDEESGLGGLDAALNDTATGFDTTTEAGKVAWDAFSELARAGLSTADAMAENGAAQEDVQAALQGTHDDLIAAAAEFGITGTAAEDLARYVMGIPDGVDIETWMDEVAKEKAIDLGTHLDSIPSELFVLANMSPDAMQQAFDTGAAIDLIDDHKLVDVVVDDQGTPGQVQSRVDSITGKTEYVLVDDNGTTTSVQQRIVNINGVDRTVWVDDNGTIYSTQAAIDGVRDGNSHIHVSDNSSDAGGRIDYAARDRTAYIRLQEIGGVGGAIGRTIATGGIAGGGWGHYKDALPRRATGGRLPYTGLGTDMILARNRHGVPTAWVDDGEWVIREQMSRKYHQALGLINQDHPAIHHLAGLNDGGQAGRTRLASSVSAGSIAPNVEVSAPPVDTAAIVSALHEMPLQVTVNADGQAILKVVANAQHGETRGRPAYPLLKQG